MADASPTGATSCPSRPEHTQDDDPRRDGEFGNGSVRESQKATVDDARPIQDHASAPDGVRLPDGAIRAYYVNGEDGGVWDGRYAESSFTPIGAIAIDGVRRPQGVVDPDALIVGGRVRLAYLSGLAPPSSSMPRAMCRADSTDGVDRTVVSRPFVSRLAMSSPIRRSPHFVAAAG